LKTGTPIYIDEKPICFWDSDSIKTNTSFIDSIDPTYFEYVAVTNFEKLQDESLKQKAALAILSNYHHALETFFVTICSAIQAPKYIVGWFQRYDNSDVRKVLEKINNDLKLKNSWNIDSFNWNKVADLVFWPKYPIEKLLRTRELFAKLWKRLSEEYLNQDFIDEYNNIKHGLRARMGGFQLFIGVEDVPGEISKNMQPVGGRSEFGCSFYTTEKVNENKWNLKLEHKSINFDPYCIANRTLLVAMSLSNALTFIRMQFNLPQEKLIWQKPIEDSHFDEVWIEDISTKRVSFSVIMDIPQKHLISKEDINQYYVAESFKFPITPT